MEGFGPEYDVGPDTICRKGGQGGVSWSGHPGQPSLPTPQVACTTPDLSQFLQRLAVFPTVQAMNPTVGEGPGPGRARPPNSVQPIWPTRAVAWSLGVRAQERLGCDRQQFR